MKLLNRNKIRPGHVLCVYSGAFAQDVKIVTLFTKDWMKSQNIEFIDEPNDDGWAQAMIQVL